MSGMRQSNENFTFVKGNPTQKNFDPLRMPIENKDRWREFTRSLDEEEDQQLKPIICKKHVMFCIPKTAYTKKYEDKNALRDSIRNSEEWEKLKEKDWINKYWRESNDM